MPGVRLDRFLASTALVLLVSTATVLAEPKFGTDIDAAPGAAKAGSPPASETTAPAAKPDTPPAQPAAPAPMTKPQAAAEPPANAAVAAVKTAESSPAIATALPKLASTAAITPQPSESSDQPPVFTLAPAVVVPPPTPNADQPAAKPSTPAPSAAQPPANPPQPTAATGGDEVPAAGAPPASTATPASAATPPSTDTAAAPAPSAVSPVDMAVTDQLRELANGKFDRVIGGRKERAIFEAFYASRNFAPLWIGDGKPNARAKGAIAYLGQVDADGLDPADYQVPNFASTADPAALAEAEIRLSIAVINYAHHAQVGRVHWTRVSGDISYDQKSQTPAEVLAAMAAAADPSAVLAAYEPQHPAYVALKAKLAELRAGKEATGRPSIPNGPALKVGMQDERVPQLRETLLRVRGDATTYDKDLAEAVKKFQQQHDIKPTGLLTPQTVDALNGRQPDRPIDTVVANLERWRWMPHELGKTYVIVNLPDYTLRVIHDGAQVWMTKIVEGKPNMPTPIMSAEMKFITVNPTWNVPPSIVAREYMPVLQQDPSMLERMGLTVSTNPDGTVHIAQPPGERNALGRLRFNFPNKFLVYQHDTPQKNLFAYDKRAFSHGCMRVQDPVRYAEVLLSIARPHDGYTQDRIRKMFGNSEQDIQFPNFIPVHLTYQTAFVDDDGKLVFREDIYGRDKALLTILRGDERKVADVPIERHDNTVRREALAMPEQSFFGGRSYYPGGGNFFSRLFSTPAAPAPAPTQNRRSAQRPTEIR